MPIGRRDPTPVYPFSNECLIVFASIYSIPDGAKNRCCLGFRIGSLSHERFNKYSTVNASRSRLRWEGNRSKEELNPMPFSGSYLIS